MSIFEIPEDLDSYPNVFQDDEPVVVTEFRIGIPFSCGWLWGHYTQEPKDELFKKYYIQQKLSFSPNKIISGEIFEEATHGKVLEVHDLKIDNVFQDFYKMYSFCDENSLQGPNIVYEGGYDEELIRKKAENKTLVDYGVVIRPVKERIEPNLGRVILKVIHE